MSAQIGAFFPTRDMPADRAAIRDWVQAEVAVPAPRATRTSVSMAVREGNCYPSLPQLRADHGIDRASARARLYQFSSMLLARRPGPQRQP